ncbi:MAG: autotransporter assembly complex protein TamA [Pseudomonadota bacterium]
MTPAHPPPSLTCTSPPHIRWVVYGVGVLLLIATSTAWGNPQAEISGGNSEIQDNVRAHLGLSSARCDLPAWRERPLVRAAREDTRKALRALGYYSPEIEVDLQRLDECWQLNVRLDPGPPVRIRTIDVTLSGGATEDSAFQAYLRDLPLREGQRLRHNQYEQIKSGLNRLASSRGYFDARFTTTQIRVQVSEQAADIVVHMDSGPRYRFGPVTLNQDILHDELGQKFVPFEQGQAFESQRLIQLQQALIDSGYFANVRVDTQPEEAQDLEVPITATLDARNQWSYLAGVGLSTDIGPRLRLGLENHRANRSGHRYSADLELAPVRSSIGLNYQIPLGDPARERVDLTTGFQTESTDNADGDLFTLGIAHIRQKPSGWTHTRFLRYEHEDYEISDTRGTSRLLTPGLEWSRIQSDHPIFPRQGWRLSANVRGASEDLLSTVTFGQATGRAKLIIPLGRGRLLTRADAGITAVDEFVELPSSVRFFAGGDNSVRGYGYRELGPTDNDGEVIGGQHFFTASLEAEYPIVGKWSAAVFVDGGNAFDDLDDYKAKYGVGAGVRWRSPIGPIRVDIAHPTDGDDNFRLHLTMGMDL